MCGYCNPRNRDPGESTWVNDSGVGPAKQAYYSGTGELEHQAELDEQRPAPGQE